MERVLCLCSCSTIIALLLAGCVIPADPKATRVRSTANPQVAAYELTLPVPGTVTVAFGQTTTYGRSTSAQHFGAAQAITLYVAGMLANTTYHLQAKIAYDDGTTVSEPDTVFATGSIPSGYIPSFTVEATNGLTPQPGVELVDILQGATPSIPFATDLQGHVIWTYLFSDRQPASILYPLKLQPNGHFIAFIAPASQTPVVSGPVSSSALNVLREFDLAGNTIRQLTMADLNSSLAAAGYDLSLQVFSHDFTVLPNGHILVIANTLKQFTKLSDYPGPISVLGDVVVDLDENFKPVWVWNEFDHLDVNRHPMSFPDWTHSNAIAYSPDDGNFLISMRSQSWIVKVDYNNGLGTGYVLWKLGYQGDFALKNGVDPTDWFYAQHDVNFVSKNTTGNFEIAIMDNGDGRTFPPNVTCDSPHAPACLYSSVQLMQVNESARTAAFDFHQILSPTLYNEFAGDTRVQANGDIEYDLAGVGADSYIYEVTPTSSPETVWQMHVEKDNTYRAFRMPSLYPGVQW